MISGPEAGINLHRNVQAEAVYYVGWKFHFVLSHVKTQAVCQRDCICLAREVLENTGLHTTAWEEQVTVLMALTNLKINYGCDEVLTEQGLAFNPGNKQSCTIQTVSAERQRAAWAHFLVTHKIKLQVANNAKTGPHHTAHFSYPLSGVGSLNNLNFAVQPVKVAKQRPRQFKLAAIHLKQTLWISDTSRI